MYSDSVSHESHTISASAFIPEYKIRESKIEASVASVLSLESVSICIKRVGICPVLSVSVTYSCPTVAS